MMMKSKKQMAEWILDFFRRNNCRANETVMFPTVMLAVGRLNPKEKNLFTNVANELVSNGYMTFEQKPVQCIRLTAKGEDYIYHPDAVLDCCVDNRKPTEKIFRDIITLGQIVSTLQTYQDIFQKNDSSDNIQLLESHFGNTQETLQLRIDTTEEYYGYLHKFFFLACQTLTLLDDTSLREVIVNYMESVERILKTKTNIQRVPMAQHISDVFIKAVSTTKTDEERWKLQNFKSLLFT